MRNLILILLIALSFINFSYSQTYNFINNVFKEYDSDTVYIEDKFIVLGKQIKDTKYLDEINFKEIWTNFPQHNSPSINFFLDNFNLNHLKADLAINKNDSIIDFSRLDKRFFASSDLYRRQNIKHTYFSISKPLYNCSKNWAVIFISSANLFYDIGSGYLYIYRKKDNEWVLYHKIELWMS